MEKQMIFVDTYKTGPLKTNCYLIRDSETNKMAIVDPGGISRKLDEDLEKFGKENVCYILLTHGHFDHIRKARRYRELTGAKIVISKDEREFTLNPNLNLSNQFGAQTIPPFRADVLVEDGDFIQLGNSKIRVIKTPGHTVGSVCYLLDNCMFSGDTLMKESVGRTDLVTGNSKDLMFSIKILGLLNGDYKIYPGHGDATTLNYERDNNEYLKNHLISLNFDLLR